MKKYLALAAATVAFSASAFAHNVEVGVGVSNVNWGGDTSASSGANPKKSTATSSFSGDLLAGYRFEFGKWHVMPELAFQTGGGKATYTEGASGIKIERKSSYTGAVRFGMDVAPKSNAFFKVGMKKGKFEYTNNVNVNTKKTEKKGGLLIALGLQTNLSEKIAVEVSYERVNYGNVKSASSSGTYYTTKMKENNARLGVSYKF